MLLRIITDLRVIQRYSGGVYIFIVIVVDLISSIENILAVGLSFIPMSYWDLTII